MRSTRSGSMHFAKQAVNHRQPLMRRGRFSGPAYFFFARRFFAGFFTFGSGVFIAARSASSGVIRNSGKAGPFLLIFTMWLRGRR